MRTRTASKSDGHRTADDALAKLLSAENRLAARLALANEQADEMLRQAREDAARVEAASEATIQASAEQLAEKYAEQLRAESAQISRQSQQMSARFAAVDDDCVREYVAFVTMRHKTKALGSQLSAQG